VKINPNNVEGKIIMDFKVAYMNFLFVTLIGMRLSTYKNIKTQAKNLIYP
jgi:hypothetical protein